jgi:DNA-binding XRE family transcriptional regulator
MRKQNKHREKMKQFRLERGWTQEDVGNMLGITGSAYGMIELGVRTPRLPLAVKMQELFGVPVAELFFEDQPNATCGEGESA